MAPGQASTVFTDWLWVWSVAGNGFSVVAVALSPQDKRGMCPYNVSGENKSLAAVYVWILVACGYHIYSAEFQQNNQLPACYDERVAASKKNPCL